MAPFQSWIIVSIWFTSHFDRQSLLSILLLLPYKLLIFGSLIHVKTCNFCLHHTPVLFLPSKAGEGGGAVRIPTKGQGIQVCSQSRFIEPFFSFFSAWFCLQPASEASRGNVNTIHNFYVRVFNRHNMQNIVTCIPLFSYSLIRELKVPISENINSTKIYSLYWCPCPDFTLGWTPSWQLHTSQRNPPSRLVSFSRLMGWDVFSWDTEDYKRQVESKQLLYNSLQDSYRVLMSKYLPF